MHTLRRFIHLAAILVMTTTVACNGGCTTTSSQTPEPKASHQQPSGVFNPAPDEPPLETVTEVPKEAPLLTFTAISDLNGRYGSDQYDDEVVRGIQMIIETRPDVVLGVGDMVAGQKAKLNYRKMWTGFHAAVTDPLTEAGLHFAPVAGNHDASAYPPYANEREIYIDEWNQRKPDLEYVDDSGYPLRYSFLVKNVLFIGVDATILSPLDDEQRAWLEDQLAHSPSPYPAVVYMHVPIFPMTTIKPTETQHDPKLHQLFVKYGVQLVITAHQHAYFPARLDGVTYLHLSALGGGPRPVQHNNGINPKTLSFISLYADHKPYIDTYMVNNKTPREHFNHNILPTYILNGESVVPRADIDIRDAEFARDYMISSHMPRSQMLTLIEALKAAGGDWSKIPRWQKDE